jgi:hypothetical protein
VPEAVFHVYPNACAAREIPSLADITADFAPSRIACQYQ